MFIQNKEPDDGDALVHVWETDRLPVSLSDEAGVQRPRYALLIYVMSFQIMLLPVLVTMLLGFSMTMQSRGVVT